MLPSTISALVDSLFVRLEARYGFVLVSHAFGYISAAKRGLSETELEDILSCDDEVYALPNGVILVFLFK